MRSFGTKFLTASLVALVVSPLFAQRQPGFGQRGAADPLTLLANKSVQEELKLPEEFVTKVSKAREEHNAKMKDAFKDAKGDMDKMKELLKTSAEESKKIADKFASELKPEQAARFKQIQIQVAGLRAYERDEVKTALKLTDKQLEEIKTTAGEIAKDIQEIRKGIPKGDQEKRAEAEKKIAELTTKGLSKISEGLTADQKKAWEALTGKKFDYKPDMPRRPGGGA
jgi:hypothetical protein